MINQFSHLKPRVIFTGKRWIVISAKHGSKRVVGRAISFANAIKIGERLFLSRIVGRALRYERLRKMGVKQAL